MKDPCVRAYEEYRKRASRRPFNTNDIIEMKRSYAIWGNAIPTDESLRLVAALLFTFQLYSKAVK